MQKDVIRLEIPMNDALGMQIVHSLRHLSSNVDHCVQLELDFLNMQMLIQTAALAPLRNDCERWLTDAAHEQQDIAMADFLQHANFVLERLQLSGRGRFDI